MLLKVILFLPSITAHEELVAVPLESETEIVPVESTQGEPLPFIFKIEFLTVTVPSPRSVATAAQC